MPYKTDRKIAHLPTERIESMNKNLNYYQSSNKYMYVNYAGEIVLPYAYSI